MEYLKSLPALSYTLLVIAAGAFTAGLLVATAAGAAFVGLGAVCLLAGLFLPFIAPGTVKLPFIEFSFQGLATTIEQTAVERGVAAELAEELGRVAATEAAAELKQLTEQREAVAKFRSLPRDTWLTCNVQTCRWMIRTFSQGREAVAFVLIAYCENCPRFHIAQYVAPARRLVEVPCIVCGADIDRYYFRLLPADTHWADLAAPNPLITNDDMETALEFTL